MQSKLHPSWHFYAGVWGVIIGIVLSLVLRQVVVRSWLWLVVALLIFLFSLQYARFWTLILALVAGLIVGNYRTSFELRGIAYFSSLVDTTCVVSGVITGDPTTSENKIALQLDHLEVQTDSATIAAAGTIYVQLAYTSVELERSDRITLNGKISAGFGNFVASLYRPAVENVERAANGDLFARLKHWFADGVRDFIPSPSVDLGLGYLVGMKSGLPENLSTMLQAIGMTHVVVASGAHLGILIGAAQKLFGKISRFAALLFSLLLILGFVLLIGGTPSMTRAALVSILSLTFAYVGRKWTPLRLISFVAMLTLLISPSYLTNLGWQLSFASFFGILLLAPLFQRTLYGGKHPPWLASMLITSAATSLLCAPILIYNFGSISLLSFVANLVILPTLPYAMLLVFLTGATSFLPIVARFFGRLADWLLQFHIMLVEFLSEKKLFIFELPSANPAIFSIYLLVLALLILPPGLKFLKAHASRRATSRAVAKTE